ncbi:uncharacterized protein LOC122019062 [Zingiber officinale]|uniref:At2g35280-like TPR domain-containing protein n=1 Tax=Zingiber officinale TaxID=94328 RepID=A0A8J5F072_ZINOF|nr:uncharacterized protein LOC122019062 [Zingiber officinale]KAG6478401.1 hypothetical protein ZIOFF_061843 [Zingiber officinale]
MWNDNVTSLPLDLAVEFCVHLVSTSTTPRKDIKCLQESCKVFHEASRARKVGKFMNVRRELELSLNWFNKKEYFELLRACVDCDNFDAYFILGLEEVFNLKEKTLGLDHLHKAKVGKHTVASYMLGMILFQEPETRSLAVEILNKLVAVDGRRVSTAAPSDDGTLIRECRMEAKEVIRRMTWEKPKRVNSLCPNQRCGGVFRTRDWDLWSYDENRIFCSDVCRWRHELALLAKS